MNNSIAIYFEHPDWFRPLFAEFARRDIDVTRLDARRFFYDPSDDASAPFRLVFNRMSPSAYLRGGGNSTFFTQALLDHWERIGVRVVNGSTAFGYEISKARQLSLLRKLGLPFPRARVINHPSQAVAASEGLRFPVVVKANIGGSGAGITRFDTIDDLKAAGDAIDLGPDGTALVQEFVPARGGHITRVETIGGRYLYGINVHTTGDSFNLCPADICQTTGGVALARSACPIDAPHSGLTVERTDPPTSVIDAIERIMQAARIDVGGIEYMVDDRDGKIVYYDINALSNFVADARNVIGFDPHERLVDFLLREAR